MHAFATDYDFNLNPSLGDLKNIDKEIALSIAGYAGLPTRNAQGNIHSDVWAIYEDRKTIGQLMSAEDIRKLLMQSIDSHIETQKKLLVEVEDPTVLVRWILDQTEAWEQQYTQAMQSNFDIAQKILTAMQEAFAELELPMEDTDLPPSATMQRILQVKQDSPHAHYYLLDENSMIRFYFRNPYTRSLMCRLAGKYLQKQIVCNRSGAYPPRVQRTDITTEKDQALMYTIDRLHKQDETDTAKILACRQLIASDNFAKWILDHKQVDWKRITELAAP